MQTLPFAFKIYKSIVKESRLIGLNDPCVVDKDECTKLPVVNCNHNSLKRDHAQGWCWH